MAKLPDHIRGISLDFANTLYPLRSGELEQTIERLHGFMEEALQFPVDYDDLHGVYMAVRERQFTENRPTLRDNDFTERIGAVVAAATGDAKPDANLVKRAEDAYVDGFVDAMVAPPGLRDIVCDLAARFRGKVAVCSNFIRVDAIHRPLERDGILSHLAGVVVSCETGFIKPHPAVFKRVVDVLKLPPGDILHVGDDWDADVLGASRYGLECVYTRQWRDEIDPSYGTETSGIVEIDTLADLLNL